MFDQAKMLAVAIVVTLSILALFTYGCATTGTTPDSNQTLDIALTIQDGAAFLTEQGLEILNREAPDEVAEARNDLMTIVAMGALYEDGQASVGDVADTITDVLDRLNARFEVFDENTTQLVTAAIDLLSRMVSRYFNAATIQPEVALYIKHFAIGVNEGLQ